MSITHTGGPAFPTVCTRYDGVKGYVQHHQEGMTLRDWFAGHASEYDIEHHRIAIVKADPTANPSREDCKWAYADAMLRSKDKRP